MNLKKIIISSVLILTSVISFAEVKKPVKKPTPIDVVKLINFHCPYSYSSLMFDSEISTYLKQYNALYVQAPISMDMTYTVKDRYYYALKQTEPTLAQEFITTMFKGVQEVQLDLFSEEQVLEYMQQVMLYDTVWPKVKNNLYTNATELAMYKAYNLLNRTGEITLPAYIMIRHGQVIGIVSPGPDEPMDKVRDRFLARYKELATMPQKGDK